MGLFDLFKRTRRAPRHIQPVMRSLPESIEIATASDAPEALAVDAPNAGEPVPPMPAPEPMELRRMLFDAVATGDEEKLARLCRDHHDFLLEYADTWSIVPAALSANPDATRWYGQGLHAIARFCAERLDRRELLDRLHSAPPADRAADAREPVVSPDASLANLALVESFLPT